MSNPDAARMDAAATDAQQELDKLEEQYPEGVAAIAKWWNEHYGPAGHKRLGRILIQYAPKEETTSKEQ